jgi:adenosylhomocysteine nucleosidase
MMSSNTYKIFIYTALPCEAKPLIEHYKLKKDLTVHAFAVYLNNDICLVVSGLGKSAMAAAVAYSQARYIAIEHAVLVNIGTAGHRQYPLGELFLIDKITDSDSKKSYYPALITTAPCRRASLQTVSKPQTEYHASELCDMEASAFYETAVRFTTNELILCLKVISDNQDSSIDAINAKQVTALIATQLSIIAALLIKVSEIAALITAPEPQLFYQLLEHYHFTAQQRQQLKSQLSRWDILTDHQSLLLEATNLVSGKDVLLWLDSRLNMIKFYL